MTRLNSIFSFIFFITILLSSGVHAANDFHHFPGVFVGYTNFDDETHFTYGVEYEYKFTQAWGIGAIYEKADDAHHGDGVSVLVAEIFYHPTGNWRFGVGAGEEKIGGTYSHSETLYRLSANYDFHVGDFGIAPTFAVDFIDGEQAYILGVAFVRPF